MQDLKINEKEIRAGAGYAALSYILFLWVVAFMKAKDNKFANYHAKQGLTAFICMMIVTVFVVVVPIRFIYNLGMFLYLLVSIYGIYSSLTGKLCKIPVISELAEKIIL